MKTIILANGQQCVVNDEDYIELSKNNWLVSRSGYACRHVAVGMGRRKIVYMHRQIIRTPSGFQTDHINHNKLDNRRENLRICTQGQNNCNSTLRVSNVSGYRGVSWFKLSKKWRARVKVNGQEIHLGLFIDKENAARAYNEAAIRLYGEFALLNKLKEGG